MHRLESTARAPQGAHYERWGLADDMAWRKGRACECELKAHNSRHLSWPWRDHWGHSRMSKDLGQKEDSKQTPSWAGPTVNSNRDHANRPMPGSGHRGVSTFLFLEIGNRNKQAWWYLLLRKGVKPKNSSTFELLPEVCNHTNRAYVYLHWEAGSHPITLENGDKLKEKKK